MTKENKGNIVFPKNKNWQPHLGVDYSYDYNCDDYTCDYICRCGVIVDPKVEPMTTYNALSMATETFKNGSGEEGKFGKALAVRLFYHGMKNVQEMFEVEVCGGYYGEEIAAVKIEEGQLWNNFLAEIEKFNSSSNSERLRQVLELEYGHILQEVDQYKEWKIIQVSVDDVKASSDVLARTNSDTVTEYQQQTSWFYDHNHWSAPDWFPGVVVVPKDEGYRVIDGFHRFKAWTTKPPHMDKKRWSRLRKKKKIMVIAPVV